MTQALMRDAESPGPSAIIADPLFKRGYEHFWSGEEPTSDRLWLPHELEAYENGRTFAAWCKESGEGKVPLVRGYLAHSRAITLLLLALHLGVM